MRGWGIAELERATPSFLEAARWRLYVEALGAAGLPALMAEAPMGASVAARTTAATNHLAAAQLRRRIYPED